MNEIHHTHIFASDIDTTIRWWKTMLGAEVAYDGKMAGARNVFLRLGRGRLHLYDQPPRSANTRGAMHHIGIRTDDLPGLTEHMRSKGALFRSEIRDFGNWRYIMTAAPDNVLLELFQIDLNTIEPALADYFGR
jgi:catechol 2,3-dioxygenase-like lactoylglutathione lyase family enzyme